MTSPLSTPQEVNPENATDEEVRVALTLWGSIGSISGLGNREWLAVARAAIAAMDGGWRDIASAPKDGRPVELFRAPPGTGVWDCRPVGMWCEVERAWIWPDTANTCWPDCNNEFEWRYYGDYYADTKFSHWRPFSPPPAVASVDAKV